MPFSFFCRFRVKTGEITVTFKEPILLVSVWIGARRDERRDKPYKGHNYKDHVVPYRNTQVYMNDRKIGTGFKHYFNSIVGFQS